MKGSYTLDFNQLTNVSEKLIMMSYAQENMEYHDHQFFELVYITGGCAVHTLNDSSAKISTGDYFIIDYGSIHKYSESKNLTLINCLFLPELIDTTLQDCHSFDTLVQTCLIRYYTPALGQTPVNRIFHDSDGRILSLLEGMEQEYQEKKTGYIEIFRCRLIEIIILTLRRMFSPIAKTLLSSTILELLSFMEQNYAKPITLGMFCNQYHFSLPYLSRRLKQETGITFRQYLQKIRIEKSCQLLTNTDLRISEIACNVGYNDIKFFHQSFKKLVKMSPREYRKLTLSMNS